MGVLGAQEVKVLLNPSGYVVEGIYNMVKGSNGHLYALYLIDLNF